MSEPNTIHTDHPATDRRALLAGIGGLAAGAILVGKAQAGPLNPPPGPVAGTGKTLTEVEPRTAINATNTPGDADSVFRISTAGSYYLTTNLAAPSGKSAIAIAASNVSIDLSGFSITSISTLASIRLVIDGASNISIRNGHIGTSGGSGIEINSASGSIITLGGCIDNVHVNGANGDGMYVGDGVLVRHCTASSNAGGGIVTGDGCTVVACIASYNGTTGISTSGGCSVIDCTASKNGADGINVNVGSLVSRCSAYSNDASGISATSSTVAASSAYANTAHGISAGTSSSVTQCDARQNTLDGIRVSSRCVVVGNNASANGTNGDGAGIHATSVSNRIEDNTCTSNDRGIDVDSTGNIIIRNVCRSNTLNWDVAAGNALLVVTAATTGAVSGNSGGASPGSTNPNANYTI